MYQTFNKKYTFGRFLKLYLIEKFTPVEYAPKKKKMQRFNQ